MPDQVAPPQHHFAPRHKARMAPYPDYNKSLVSQRRESPVAAGGQRAVQTGLTGAVLGALIARLVSNKPSAVAAGAGIGGVVGAVPGFVSGKREAESDYSKLLFLRRRMGINEPGELDALLQNPELMQSMVEKDSMDKQAVPLGTVAKVLAGVGVGGAAGWQLGTEGTSRLMGYHDDPAARHQGGAVNAANLAIIGGLLAHNPRAAAQLAREHIMLPGAMLGAEVIPVATKSMRDMATANEAQAKGQLAPTIGRMLNTDMARGAGVGVGLAGLASILTGLTRARKDEEIRKDRSRGSMVAHDFLKYVAPAAAGGAVVGSLK